MTIVRFLREPWIRIRNLPNWDWQQMLLAHLFLSISVGVLTGISQSFLALIAGIFISPLFGFITISFGALLIFYAGKFLLNKTISYRKIWTLVLFANIPFQILQLIAIYIPVISILGFACTLYLLYLGLTESHGFSKEIAKKTLAGLLGVFVLLWLWNQWDTSKLEKAFRSGTSSNAPEVHLGK